MQLCPPKIPHDLTWDQTRPTAVWSQRLTARAMAEPKLWCYGALSPRLTPSVIGHMLPLSWGRPFIHNPRTCLVVATWYQPNTVLLVHK
jgi:hypothetical protein